MQRVYFKDLPVLTEAADEDTLLARDASEDKVGVFSIATLRAAMGSSDRIESPSGDAFVEASKFNGSPRTIARSGVGQGYAIQATFSDGDKSSSELIVKGAGSPSAGIRAEFDEGAYTLSAHGAPLQVEDPIESNHAATKGYVDARPGAEKWSEHAATQDVDLDGFKLTGLGEPTEDDDAATKGYVDGAAGRNTYWGEYVGANATYLPNSSSNPLSGDDYDRLKVGDIATFMTSGTPGRVALYRCQTRGNEGGAGGVFARWRAITPESDNDNNAIQYVSILRATGINNYSDGFTRRQDVADWSFVSGNGNANGKRFTNLGAPVNNADAATKKYVDDRYVVEWWEPVWTPVENVDSVSNVECQYTRTYRAAGGSLVTLEGTITVEINEDDSGAYIYAALPVPATSAEMLLAPAFGVDLSRGDLAVCGAVVADAGSGPALAIDAGVLENATGVPATLTIGFRVSYRAA